MGLINQQQSERICVFSDWKIEHYASVGSGFFDVDADGILGHAHQFWVAADFGFEVAFVADLAVPRNERDCQAVALFHSGFF